MAVIPPSMLEKLYVEGSLRAEDEGFAFDLKNLVAPAVITGFEGLDVDGRPMDPAQVTVEPPSHNPRAMDRISPRRPLHFPVGAIITLRVAGQTLHPGRHELTVHLEVKEIGPLDVPISDDLA